MSAVPDDALPATDPSWGQVFRLIRRQPLGAIGGLIVILMIFAAIFADAITSYDPVANDFMAMSEAPRSS